MDILTIAVTGTLCIVCFFVGAKVGQKVDKGETLELPTINPIEAIRSNEEKREARREQERIDTIMRNIEKYDGTPLGQEDIPR